MYIWKDYSDYFFVTVSLNATGFGPAWPQGVAGNPGQYLFAQPSVYNPSGGPSGFLSVSMGVCI